MLTRCNSLNAVIHLSLNTGISMLQVLKGVVRSTGISNVCPSNAYLYCLRSLLELEEISNSGLLP